MFIIALILALSIRSSYSTCAEQGETFNLPSKYHKGINRHPIHFERIIIKRDDVELGSILPDGDIWEIYPYRIFGFVYPGHNKFKIYFKPAINNTNDGFYHIDLVIKWNQIEPMGSMIFTADSSTPSVRRVNNNFAIIENIHHYSCGDDNVPTLWNVIWKGTLQVMSTKSNTIRKSRIAGFTKMYCEASMACHTSNILRKDGLEEELTWESDFRHTKIGYKIALEKKQYSTSVTDWYIPISLPERVRILYENTEILDITERKKVSNINNLGVTLIWMDDKMRLEFDDTYAGEFKVAFDWEVRKFKSYAIMWIQYTPPTHDKDTKIIYRCNTGNILQASLVLLIVALIVAPPPHFE